MAREVKTVKVKRGSELDRLLEEAAGSPLVLDRDGERYRLEPKEDIWRDYDPEKALAAIDAITGIWSGIDAEAMKARIYIVPVRKAHGRPTTMNYLVDTDLIIDAAAGFRFASELLKRRAADGLAVSVITLGELYEGAYDFPDPDAQIATLRRSLPGVTILGLDDEIVRLFAQERYRLRRQGNLIPDLDLLIAATALHHDLTLMTRNVRHFSRIPNLKLYQP